MAIQKKIYDRYLLELDEGFDIFYYSDVGNKKLHPHKHLYYELYILVAGDVAVHYKGKITVLKPGDMLLINKNEIHCTILMDPNVSYERIILNISAETLSRLSNDDINLTDCFYESINRVHRFPYEVQSTIRLLIGKMLTLKQKKPYGHTLLLDSYLTELFVMVNQQTKNLKEITVNEELKSNQLIEVVKQYIAENIEFDIGIDELIGLACVSKYHLMRLFKKHTGQTIYQYILDKRLESAFSLIKTGMDFTTACYECGFNDYSCFYRAFKKKYKTSPSEYFSNINYI